MARVFSKRSFEGYLLIDHSNSPGITEAQALAAGHGTMPIAAGTKFEAATYNCSHCERLVVMNPKRTRARGYCPKCDHDICDECEAVRVASGGACKPMKQVIDEFIDHAAKVPLF